MGRDLVMISMLRYKECIHFITIDIVISHNDFTFCRLEGADRERSKADSFWFGLFALQQSSQQAEGQKDLISHLNIYCIDKFEIK